MNSTLLSMMTRAAYQESKLGAAFWARTLFHADHPQLAEFVDGGLGDRISLTPIPHLSDPERSTT